MCMHVCMLHTSVWVCHDHCCNYVHTCHHVPCICMQVTWTCAENIPSWTAQDIAVLCLIFCSWERLKAFEASSRPMQLKVAAVRKFLHQRWLGTCALRLQTGLYVQKTGRKQQFDGTSVLQLVGEYRSRSKARNRFIAQVKHELEVHYASVPEVYRPADKHQPLHKHWQQARRFQPPPIPKAKLMRKVLSRSSYMMHYHVHTVKNTYTFTYICRQRRRQQRRRHRQNSSKSMKRNRSEISTRKKISTRRWTTQSLQY